MKLFKQILILFSLCVISEIVSKLLPFRFPSNVIGMILLLLLLLFKIIKTDFIQNTAEFLLQNMAFFFIPSTVSIMNELDYLKDKILILVFIAVFSLIVTFVVAAFAVKLTTKIFTGKTSQTHE